MITLESVRGCGQAPRVAFMLEALHEPYRVISYNDGHFFRSYGRPGPRLVDGSVEIFESATMLRHLERHAPYANTLSAADHAAVDGWIELSSRLGTGALFLMRDGQGPAGAFARQILELGLELVDTELADRPYAVGDAFTAADAALSVLIPLAPYVRLDRWPDAQRYLHGLARHPAFVHARRCLEQARQTTPGVATVVAGGG